MRKQYLLAALTAALLSGVHLEPVLADPCGMVPPIYTGPQIPLARVGLQQTYVFYKDGVETFVIRPGFTGKVDEFGMLIPMPSVPAIRKVPDHVFGHLAAAVDPPEVVVDLRQQLLRRFAKSASRTANSPNADQGLEFKREEVKVIKEEAVGMYEVAVLEAGSAAALKRWMDDHGYKYPEGMDEACEDYVDDGWCFVAVKTKVGQKEGVDPKPGQRDVESKLPDGSIFDGHVQGMGFRFRVDELVVPMRLSAFNEGELRNVVYLLTDGPRKIQWMPEEYVVRQIPGDQLFRNVTDPLPLRIIGGTEDEIPEFQRRNLPQRRDPVPHNGAARELFASDLLAASTGELALPHEEREKELLRIGEHLGLRGPQIDKLNTDILAEERNKTVEQALAGVKNMTLTVIDGDFPRELLSRNNLKFAAHHMPARRNSPESYDAKLNGPAPKKIGIIKLGALEPKNNADEAVAAAQPVGVFRVLAWLISALAVAAVGFVLAVRLAHSHRVGGALILLIALGLISAPSAFAQDNKDDEKKPTIRELMRDLSSAENAEEVIKALVARKDEAKAPLMGEALEGNDLARRGWAIVALAEIGGKDVEDHFTKIHNDDKQSMLIRTWAAAARVYMTASTDELVKRADLAQLFPAVGRPLGLRVVESLSKKDEPASPEGLLEISLKVPQLQQALAPAILALGSEKLTTVMTTAKELEVRRQATAYLGTLANQGDKEAAPAVVKIYKFNPDAEEVPWNGGPLYVPGLQWDKDNAKALVGNLIAWHLWCDRKGKSGEQQQIRNNLNSIQLAQAAGYQFGSQDTVGWLKAWVQAAGKKEVEQMLKDQGVEDVKKYSSVLE